MAMSLGLIELARAHAPLLDLGGRDPLAPQGGLHLVLAAARFATHLLAVAVLALPLEDELSDCS
jgi:hypothetical protein